VTANNNSVPLLTLLSLADSALPIGAYSHSWGLETWVQNGALNNANDVLEAIRALLVLSLGPLDGTACALAHSYQFNREFSLFEKLNKQLTAARWTKETHEASTSMGERLYKLCFDLKLVKDDRERLPKPLHHSAAFGWVASAASIPRPEAVAAFLQSSCTSLISACVRLIPLGQTDGQRIITSLRPTVDVIAAACLDCDLDEVGSFGPLNEWASVEHQSLYSRLFQS
jgi:urease accessory protein